MMNYKEHITIEAGIHGGKFCTREVHISVYGVLSWLADSMSEVDIIEDYPELTHDDINACLSFVANREHNIGALM